MSGDHVGECGLVQELSLRVGEIEKSVTKLRVDNAGYLGEKRVYVYIIIALQLIITLGLVGIGLKTIKVSEDLIRVKSMTSYNQRFLKGEIKQRGGHEDEPNK